MVSSSTGVSEYMDPSVAPVYESRQLDGLQRPSL